MNKGESTHLGDGAYADFDGYYWWLSAEREGRVHLVALEPSALLNLVAKAVHDYPTMADAIRHELQQWAAS